MSVKKRRYLGALTDVALWEKTRLGACGTLPLFYTSLVVDMLISDFGMGRKGFIHITIGKFCKINYFVQFLDEVGLGKQK